MRVMIFILILIFGAFFLGTSFAQEASCDYKVDIIINNTEFESKNFSWKIRVAKIEGPPTNISAVAQIQDNEGRVIKSYRPWTNSSISKQKTSSTYSPNLNIGKYILVSSIDVKCDDFNKDNNQDSKTIKIILPQEKNKFAKNNSDEAINQASLAGPPISKMEANNKTSNQSAKNNSGDLKNTAQIKEDKKIQQEQFDNVIQLKSEVSNADENKITANIAKEPKKEHYNSKVVYESSSEKSRKIILISILALSVILNIVLIWKR